MAALCEQCFELRVELGVEGQEPNVREVSSACRGMIGTWMAWVSHVGSASDQHVNMLWDWVALGRL